MKLFRNIGLVLGSALSLAIILPAGAASAANYDCWSGYACIWDTTNYGSGKYGVSLNKGTLVGTSHDNNAESASGNGASCNTVSFFTSPTRVVSANQPYFYLGSKQRYMGYAWKDSNLNGVDEIGYAQHYSVYDYDFRNKISSWEFSECS